MALKGSAQTPNPETESQAEPSWAGRLIAWHFVAFQLFSFSHFAIFKFRGIDLINIELRIYHTVGMLKKFDLMYSKNVASA